LCIGSKGSKQDTNQQNRSFFMDCVLALTGVFKLSQNIMYRQTDDAALKQKKWECTEKTWMQRHAKMPAQQKQQQSPVAEHSRVRLRLAMYCFL
jgi:hypothetical protein